MTDPTAYIHLESGRVFAMLWGDPAEYGSVEQGIKSLREHVRSGETCWGKFTTQPYDFCRDVDVATVIDPARIESIQMVQDKPHGNIAS